MRMRTTAFLPLLALAVAATPGVAAPKKAPKAPPPPPKRGAKLPTARPTPPGRILTLKPGQTRLTPEQLALVTGKPVPPKKALVKKTPVKKTRR